MGVNKSPGKKMPHGLSLAAFALFFVVCSVSSYGLIVDVSETIVVKQEQVTVPVSITNDSDATLDYDIELSIPGNASITPPYGSLRPGKKIIASLSISPDNALEGSTYKGSIRVALGEEKATRHVSVLFKEAGEAQPKGDNGGNNEEPALNPLGFFSLPDLTGLFSFENMLNAALALIGAVLLIAFIARFVKRLEGGK